VALGFPRIEAQKLGRDFALSLVTNDLYVEKGNIAEVSGLAALPQKVRSCLSLQAGESPVHPTFGGRFGEYFHAFKGSPWLGRLFKLETIRQAAIPYYDHVLKQQYTPLQCVERVHSVEVLADAPTKNWLPVRFEFDVKGVGRWQYDLPIFIPPEFGISNV
jgi:hypothetical protein